MDFITGSYCIDTGGKSPIESLKDYQEDTRSAGPEAPAIPKDERLRELINTPYEGLGIDYLKRVAKELSQNKATNFSLNINDSNYPLSPWINPKLITGTVKRVSDFISTKGDPNMKLKDLTDRELWDIAFYLLRNLPDYGKKCANHFWSRSGKECIHPHVKKSLLEKGPLRKLLNAINKKVSDSVFQNGKKAFLYSNIDVTDIIRDNFPSLRMDQFEGIDVGLNISEIGVFGGVKEVNITGRFEDLSNYTDFDYSNEIQPYSLIVNIKDWFGVDEDDVVNSKSPAIIQRYQLAAFWILQHQRGYLPFVNTLQFDRHHEFAQNYRKILSF